MSKQALARAVLKKIDWDKNGKVSESGKEIAVQFNPETLTVAYANQKAGEGQSGGSALQYVGQGTSKLSMDLWFDITGTLPKGKESIRDVRKLTQEVVAFIKPEEIKKNKWKAPGLRFLWGNFLFDGVVESITEKLDFFAEDGRALRAQLSLSIGSQEIQFAMRDSVGSNTGATNRMPGREPLKTPQGGQSLQSLAAGIAASWQQVATANRVENPRHPGADQPLNLNPKSR